MAKNMQALQEALKGAQSQPKASQPVAEAVAGQSYMAPSREGKTNITAYLSPDYKASLRLIQARTGGSLQDLVAEALNDLFRKYDVPTVEQ
jgi:DNA-binding protein YbaB